MNPPVQHSEIAAIVERLEKQFPDVPPPEVAAVAIEAHDAFNDHPIKTSSSRACGAPGEGAPERAIGRPVMIGIERFA